MSIDQRLINESLFIQAFQYAPIGMVLVSLNGRCLKANPAICSILGYSELELSTLTFQEITHPEDLILDLQLMTELLTGKRDSYQMEKRYIHKDGHIVWSLLAVSLAQDEESHTPFFVSQIIDISVQKQMENELRKKERLLYEKDVHYQNSMTKHLEQIYELYRMISDHVLDIISISSPEGVTRHISPAVQSLLGYEMDEIVGTKIMDLWHPDDLLALGERCLLSHTDVDMFICRVRHKEGHYVWFETTVKMIRNEKGEVDKIVAVGRDITKRKQAEDELCATRERLESFIKNNGDAIWVIDRDDKVVEINAAFGKLFQWKSEEIIHQSLPITPPNLADQTRELHKQVLSGQSVIGFETVRLRKDGSLVDVSTTLSPIHDTTGHIIGIAGTCHDITEKKQAEQLLINSEKLSIAGQLAAGIAHEIRNPITAIKGFIQLMKSGVTEKKLYYEIMSSEIERIEMILSELLILAKPQMIHSDRKDIRNILSQVTTLLESQALLNNVEIITECEPDLPPILCDQNQLKQVCINFIKNGIEAMSLGGTLLIQVKTQNGNRLILRFIDQGCGIPEHIITKLGQPFYTTKEKGTGLGFMVSKKIIESHNGTVNVFSKDKEGTTVEVCLPTYN
ncbi:PAS domain S-box protein [Paenibacillus chondroitinus]|uniref:histidine kinase n=1 Tax=Paenibacillus chondroitinus TaxID=59842 RepID=A0ABU6DJ10_9BACL|nr:MULTISPECIES: PAS domain S-box protein [Paenibacillus]MCY9659572.1 PAS domain S-box protein [Paenibacillus anseongense]MEB4796968.1 PAS domain S-box protein [Paenibacillus chondroitinus]